MYLYLSPSRFCEVKRARSPELGSGRAGLRGRCSESHNRLGLCSTGGHLLLFLHHVCQNTEDVVLRDLLSKITAGNGTSWSSGEAEPGAHSGSEPAPTSNPDVDLRGRDFQIEYPM